MASNFNTLNNFSAEVTLMILDKLEIVGDVHSASLVCREFSVLLDKRRKSIRSRQKLDSVRFVPVFIPKAKRALYKEEEDKKYRNGDVVYVLQNGIKIGEIVRLLTVFGDYWAGWIFTQKTHWANKSELIINQWCKKNEDKLKSKYKNKARLLTSLSNGTLVGWGNPYCSEREPEFYIPLTEVIDEVIFMYHLAMNHSLE